MKITKKERNTILHYLSFIISHKALKKTVLNLHFQMTLDKAFCRKMHTL